MSDEIEISIKITGAKGVGKSTLAILIQRYLRTMGFEITVKLANNAMPPCPTELRKKTTEIIRNKTRIHVEEE